MFAALFNRDRQPIDPLPDASLEMRVMGGARHVALLRAASASPPRDRETSAIESLDDRFSMVGRLRLDGRAELVARLGLAQGSAPHSDAGLCLRAYAKWGESFVDRLIGDFAFVLWDEVRERLIAVRDHLGVRSLFHAEAGRCWMAANSLDWLLSRPGLDRGLDDHWIADFLATGYCLDFERTAYRAIARLAPAHVASIGGSDATTRRFWRLTADEPLHLGDRRLYAEIFHDHALRAVRDRLPEGRVGISMSGGLDSTALAATAVEASDASRVVAMCLYFERLVSDDELAYARMAADRLAIELHEVACDDGQYDPLWRSEPARTAEPWADVMQARHHRTLAAAMASLSPVWLEGEGPDNALKFERGPYLSWLCRRGEWRRLAQALGGYVRAKGLRGWRSTLRRYTMGGGADPAGPQLPPWLNPDLVDRLALGERLHARPEGPPHPWHPRAVASFADPVWQGVLADAEIGETEAPFIWRHPLLDVRLLQFMIAVPPVPWAYRKLIVREAMRGKLPTAVLEREKTPLRIDPFARAFQGQQLPPLAAGGALGRWIDVDRLTRSGAANEHSEALLRAHALDHWLATRPG